MERRPEPAETVAKMLESSTLPLCRDAQGHSRTPLEGVSQQSLWAPAVVSNPCPFRHRLSQIGVLFMTRFFDRCLKRSRPAGFFAYASSRHREAALRIPRAEHRHRRDATAR